MSLGVYNGAGAGITKLLLHLEGSSTDSSGNGNNGTDSNMSYVNGKFGKCASFNGSSSKISVPSNMLGGASAITISCWVNLANHASQILAGDGRTVFRDDDTDIILRASYGDTAGGDRGPEFGITTSSGFKSINVSPRTYISLNTWHNLIGVYTGSNIYLYYDGNLISSTTHTGSISSNGSAAFIGCSNGNAYFFNGLIEEVIIENRAWSAEEVKKRYTDSLGRFATI